MSLHVSILASGVKRLFRYCFRVPVANLNDAISSQVACLLKEERAKRGLSLNVLAQKAGLKLPIESHVLQAFVSESIKPVVNHVVVWSATYFYVSQSDKGGLVFGGHIDRYNSYAQRGNLPSIAETAQGLVSLIPFTARLRLLRHWGGIMDMTPDGSPIITTTPVPGLYLNGGWCYGGFKATPASGWCFAHTIANDEAHPHSAGFTMDRFAKGRYIDEAGYGPYNHLQ